MPSADPSDVLTVAGYAYGQTLEQVLKQAGLVVDRRDAQWVRYRLNPDLPGNVRTLIDAALMEEVEA